MKLGSEFVVPILWHPFAFIFRIQFCNSRSNSWGPNDRTCSADSPVLEVQLVCSSECLTWLMRQIFWLLIKRGRRGHKPQHMPPHLLRLRLGVDHYDMSTPWKLCTLGEASICLACVWNWFKLFYPFRRLIAWKPGIRLLKSREGNHGIYVWIIPT
jgi:hypothetical protein